MGGNRRQFPACDGLRAVAAGSVFVFHAAALTGLSLRSAYGHYFRELDVGVDIFFVLSGFLLYRPFVRAHLYGDDSPDVGRYFRRRFLRIFPAYWLAFAAVVWMFDQATVHTLGDGFIFFGLAQIYSSQHVLGGLVPVWSLCTEITFYVFLPAYAWVLQRLARSDDRADRLRAELIGLGALYVASAVFRIVISATGYHLAENWLPAYLDVFVLGMLLAVLSVVAEHDPGARWFRMVPKRGAVWWAAAFAFFLMVSNLGMPIGLVAVPTSKYMAHHLLAGLVGVFAVCPAVLHDDAGGAGRETLSSPALRWLGFISYGIFLWHLPWIVQAIKWTGGKPYFADMWPVLLLSAGLTLVTAWLTYVLVERPLSGGRPRRLRASKPGIPATTPR